MPVFQGHLYSATSKIRILPTAGPGHCTSVRVPIESGPSVTLEFFKVTASILPCSHHAGVAQLVEQLICNQPVVGSNPIVSSIAYECTKLPLTTWFLGIYILTQPKNGTSVLELKRPLGISYNAAWRLKYKRMQAMKERDDSQPLSGNVQMDDVYVGGERPGGKRGRGAAGKTPVVTAVQINGDGHPIAMRLSKP